MNFELRVVSDADYQRYLDALARLGNTDPDRQAKALTEIGQAPRATTTHPFETNRTAREASERSSREQNQGQGQVQRQGATR
jgi:cytochrome c oxidase subunit 2